MASSINFAFLQEHDPVFLQLASTAEHAFASDPNTTLIKLRQLGEALAQDLAGRSGIEFDANTPSQNCSTNLVVRSNWIKTFAVCFTPYALKGTKPSTNSVRNTVKPWMG